MTRVSKEKIEVNKQKKDIKREISDRKLKML